MKSQLRHLVAGALYPIKSYSLPAVCERYGLESGTPDEAYSSKTRYVMGRLEKLSDAKVLSVAKLVIEDYPDDALRAAVELLDKDGLIVSDITRHHLAEALNGFALSGKRDHLELFRKHWPDISKMPSVVDDYGSLADDISGQVYRNDYWPNSETLEKVGFLTCSQAKLFEFLEDIHPVRRDADEQEEIVSTLNPILRRDGYVLALSGRRSGYPVYRVQETTATGVQPADNLISEALRSFDESGVHAAWRRPSTAG